MATGVQWGEDIKLLRELSEFFWKGVDESGDPNLLDLSEEEAIRSKLKAIIEKYRLPYEILAEDYEPARAYGQQSLGDARIPPPSAQRPGGTGTRTF